MGLVWSVVRQRRRKKNLLGEFNFSEGNSTKWIFDIEVKKLKTENFVPCLKDKNEASETNIL
jgi:hypothetical protein